MANRPAKKAAKKAAPRKPRLPNIHPNLPDAQRTLEDAHHFIVQQTRNQTQDWTRLCLSLVRQTWGAAIDHGVYATAAEAWRHVKDPHKWTGNVREIPFGAVMFSHRPNAGPDDAGHVFTIWGYNRKGERICRGNDIKGLGDVSCFQLSDLVEKWGHEILGWADNVNGYQLPLQGPPKPPKRRK